MSEFNLNPYGQNYGEQYKVIDTYDEPVVDTDQKYEMTASDIDGVAAMVFEQVAQNPDSVAYHIYNIDPDAIGLKIGMQNQEISEGHNYLYGDDADVNAMVATMDAGIDQARGLKNDDPYVRAELLVLEEKSDGSYVVGYGISGKDDAGRPKYDHVSFKLEGAAAAMMYAAAEDPVAIDKVIELVSQATGLPERIYDENLDPAKANFGDQILNVVKTGPGGHDFTRIKKRPKSSIK